MNPQSQHTAKDPIKSTITNSLVNLDYPLPPHFLWFLIF